MHAAYSIRLTHDGKARQNENFFFHWRNELPHIGARNKSCIKGNDELWRRQSFVVLNMMCVRKLKWRSDILRVCNARRLLAWARAAVYIACANKRLLHCSQLHNFKHCFELSPKERRNNQDMCFFIPYYRKPSAFIISAVVERNRRRAWI